RSGRQPGFGMPGGVGPDRAAPHDRARRDECDRQEQSAGNGQSKLITVADRDRERGPDGQRVRRIGHGKDRPNRRDVEHRTAAGDEAGKKDEVTALVEPRGRLGHEDEYNRRRHQYGDLRRGGERSPETVEEQIDRRRESERADERARAHAERHVSLHRASIQIEAFRQLGDEPLVMLENGAPLVGRQPNDAVLLERRQLEAERTNLVDARLRILLVHTGNEANGRERYALARTWAAITIRWASDVP